MGSVEPIFLIDIHRIVQDLPPFCEHDSVECFWEVRDPLDVAVLAEFEALRDRLELQNAKFLGVRLYARDAASLHTHANLSADISKTCGISPEEPVLVLNEEGIRTAQPIDPLPMEIAGMLVRRTIHDLRTNLSTVLTKTGIATERVELPESVRAPLAEVRAAAERAAGLTEIMEARCEAFRAPQGKHSGLEIESALRSASPVNWSINAIHAVSGDAVCDLRWLTFAVRSIIVGESDSGEMRIEVKELSQAEPAAPAGSGDTSRVIEISGDAPVPESVWASDAGAEYIRSIGGWLAQREGRSCIFLPLECSKAEAANSSAGSYPS